MVKLTTKDKLLFVQSQFDKIPDDGKVAGGVVTGVPSAKKRLVIMGQLLDSPLTEEQEYSIEHILTKLLENAMNINYRNSRNTPGEDEEYRQFIARDDKNNFEKKVSEKLDALNEKVDEKAADVDALELDLAFIDERISGTVKVDEPKKTLNEYRSEKYTKMRQQMGQMGNNQDLVR